MGHGVENPYDDTALLAIVNAIREITDVTPVLTETGGTLTADGTEQNVYINNAPAGVYRPICVKIDFTNHEATETVVLRTYYRIADGGGWLQDDGVTYIGVPTVPLINVELLPTRFGVRVTLEKTAGTNRAYGWEAFYEVAP